MVNILRKRQENYEAQFPKFSVFICQKSIFRRYCIPNVKDGIQIQVYNISNEIVNLSSQFISVEVNKKVKKITGSILGKVKKIEAIAKWRFL